MIDLTESRVLITGGTGSFGGYVSRALYELGTEKIRIFSRDERKQWEMKQRFPKFGYVIGDVRNRESVSDAMDGVDVVFHAAAMKHVPVCESFPDEAFFTNVMGSINVCEEAKRHRVKVCIGLSTDKAVKPISAMGISKAMMEKIFCSQNRIKCNTTFSCVRFGNILGSSGSVLPLFIKQVKDGESFTITDPDMTRFFMTPKEAVDLVLHAMNYSTGGDIYVKKSPACKLYDLALSVWKKYGGLQNGYTSSGPRPGERKHEVLISDVELNRVVELPEFFKILPEWKLVPGESIKNEFTSQNTKQLTVHELVQLLDEVEEYNKI